MRPIRKNELFWSRLIISGGFLGLAVLVFAADNPNILDKLNINFSVATIVGKLGLANGGTNADLSATGGTSQFLKQASAGAAVTVAQPACSDLSNAASSCSTDTTSASNISGGTLAAARGGAGTINGALKGNGSGAVSQAACTDLSNGGGYCSISAGVITNSIAGDVTLNNTGTYFDGPSVAQGSTGTWCGGGTVTVVDSTGTSAFQIKMWDGTTVISSLQGTTNGTSLTTFSLSGCLASPAGNIRISVKDATNATGLIKANNSGNAKDSTITVWRVN